MSHSIITFVQLINTRFALTETSYQFKELRTKKMVTVSGEQSNEAPVFALLNTLPNEIKAGKDRSIRIICLVSKEVLNEIAFERQSKSEHEVNEQVRMSSYDYFCQKINLRWQGQAKLDFIRVEYSETEAEKCIPSLLKLFKPGDEVRIDITSGMRTLPIHVTLCMEAMIHQHIEIKDVVYAYLNKDDPSKNQIRHEKHVDRIINLITAVHDFLDHGKADQLVACLDGAKKPLPSLSSQIKAFSDKLILCRVNGITDDVDEIHSTMDTIIETYNNCPDSFKDSPTQIHTFLSLLPTIKENFVDNCPNVDAKQALYMKKLSLILWCTQRNLLQLALSLYRENVADIIFALDLISINKRSPLRNNFTARRDIDLIDYYKAYEQTILDRMHRIMPTYEEIDKKINHLASKKNEGKKENILTLISESVQLESTVPPKSITDLIQLETELIQLWKTKKDKTIQNGIDNLIWNGKRGKSTFISLFEISPNAAPPQALRPDEESLDIIEETGITINMSLRNFQDCLTYAYYLNFVRNTFMHAGTFNCKLACDSIQTNRPDQPILYTGINDPRALTAAFISKTLTQAVKVIQEAFYDPNKNRYHQQRIPARRERAILRELAKVEAMNAERREDALNAVWSVFSKQCNGKQIQAKIIISTDEGQQGPCVDVDSMDFESLWDRSKVCFSYIKVDGSSADFDLRDVCKFALTGRPEENLGLADGNEHTFTLSVKSPNCRRVLLVLSR